MTGRSWRLTGTRVARALSVVVVTLLTASLAGQIYNIGHGINRSYGLVAFLDVNDEQNLPTVYSALALLLAAGLGGLVAGARWPASRRERLQWGGLGVVFLYMALDELMQIHERLLRVPGLSMRTTGFAPWIPLAAAVALVVGVLYLPFLARLPPRTRVRFVAAGVIYLGGALVVELVDDLLVSFRAYPQRSLAHVLASTLKEGLEMFGVVIYIHALLDYVAITLGGARVRLFRWLEMIIEPAGSPGAGERSPGSGPAGK